jgi:hypothetical protein
MLKLMQDMPSFKGFRVTCPVCRQVVKALQTALTDFCNIGNIRILEMSGHDTDKLFLFRMYETTVPCRGGW